ncbi:Pr6Pr family membrane protein, partial [Streptomyces sp. MBT59]|uniref:Pr6Pr family membrane protein n=1 Tax=Streptomyces sp. MBT59 TaxID=1488390 RepID=UPI001F41991E
PRAAEVLRDPTGPRRPWATALRTLACGAAVAGPAITVATGYTPPPLIHFTVLANLLVAVAFGWSAVRSWRGAPPLPPYLTGGMLLLAAITALMHHLVLVNYPETPAPGTGWSLAATLLLHTVTPLAVAADWLLLTSPRTLRLAHIPLWLTAPAAYLCLVLTRGALLSPSSPTRYPYPFLDVDTYGTKRSWVQIPPPRQLKHQVRPGSERSEPGLICFAARFWEPFGSQLGVIFEIRLPVAPRGAAFCLHSPRAYASRPGSVTAQLVPSRPKTVRRLPCTLGLR